MDRQIVIGIRELPGCWKVKVEAKARTRNLNLPSLAGVGRVQWG
jgi:hypothetical protein